MDPRLIRRYRRLVRWYPPGPRREELLGTLLESAAPGQTRPGRTEAVNLARHGMRARLGHPGSTGIVVLAALIALVGALAGASVTARLAWQTAPALPAGDEAAEITSTVFPGLRVLGGGDAALFVDSGDGITHGHADYWVGHTDATRDVLAYAQGARQRLIDAGWTAHAEVRFDDAPDSVTPTDTASFWAYRGNVILSFSNSRWDGMPAWNTDGAAAFQLARAEPALVRWATLPGALIGALLGWLLTGWASRRTAPSPLRTALALLGTAGVLLMLSPTLLFGLARVLFGAADTTYPPLEPLFAQLLPLGVGPVYLAGLLAAGVLAVAAVPPLGLPAVPRRAWWALAAVALAGVAALVWPARPGACDPGGPPTAAPPGTVRLSRVAHVFVAQESTPDQRNLIDAAIFNVYGTRAVNFHYDPTEAEYGRAYCDSARANPADGMELPYFFTVDLSSPGVFPVLEQAVVTMPGVVAVRHAPGGG